MMRIVDIDVANAEYDYEHEIPEAISSLRNHFKYLRLKIGDSVFDLEIEEVEYDEVIIRPLLKNLQEEIEVGRFCIKNGTIVDEYDEYESINLKDEENLECFLNKMEMDKLEYKRQLNTLKHRIGQLVK